MGEQFIITPERATATAQAIHNSYDVNGEIDYQNIYSHFQMKLEEWLDEHVDWEKILDDDADTKDTIKEIEEAKKGVY